MRRLLIVAAVALILLAAYLQTADGFRRVILPALGLGLGGECEARDGRLRLNGSVEADGFTFRDPEGGVDFSAEHLEARVGLASLLSGRPRIVSIGIRNAALRLDAGSTDQPQGPESRAPSMHDLLRFHLPVDIERATVSDSTVVFTRDAVTRARLGPLQLELLGLAPSATARLELSTGLALAPGVAPAEYTGRGHATLRLEQTAAAELRRWTLDGELDLAQKDADAFRFAIASTGTVGKRAATAAVRVAGTRGTEALGTVDAAFDIPAPAKASTKDDPSGPRVTVALQALTSSFLDPFVAALGDAHLASGQLDGSVQIQPATAGDAIDVRADLDGRNLRLVRSAAAAAPGAPLRLRLNQHGTWHSAARRLELRDAAASLALGETTVLALELLGPTAISFAEAAAAAPAQSAPPSVRTRINDLPIAALADWLALVGVGLPAPLADATLDGELTFGAPPSGAPILADGRVNVHHLSLGGATGEFSVEGAAHAEIVPARGARLEHVAIQLQRLREPLALAQVSGSLGWQPAGLALDVGVDVPDVVEALQRAGVAQAAPLRGGRLRVEGRLSQPHDGVQLDALLRLVGLEVRGPKRAMERDLTGAVTLRGDAETLRIAVTDLRTVASGTAAGGAAAGDGMDACAAQGDVSLTSDGNGRLDVRCTGIALAPWLGLAVDGWSAMGPTPADATIAVQFDAQGSVRIDGQQTIQVRDLDGRPFSVALTNALRRSGDTTELDLTVQSSRPTPDRATFAGSLQDRTRPQLRVSAAIESADLTPLAPLLEAQREVIEKFGAEVGRAVRRRALRPADLPRLPLDIEADVTVGQVRYRAIHAESGRVTARLYNTRWDVDMTPTGFAGGRLSGHFDRSIETWHETIALTARVGDVGLSSVISSLRGGDPTQVDGTLTVEVDLRGRSPSDANILDAANGTVGLTLNHARLRGFEPLQFLAARTGVTQLARIPLDTFDVIANANVERGVARLDRTVVVSAAAHYEIDGRITPDGQLDLTVLPLVGPGIARDLGGLGVLQRVVGAVEGLAALPILIRVRGPIENPRYSAEPTTPRALDTTAGIVGGAAKEVGGIVDGVKGLFGDRRKK